MLFSKGLLFGIIRLRVWFRTQTYKEDGVYLILAKVECARNKYTYDYEEYRKHRIL